MQSVVSARQRRDQRPQILDVGSSRFRCLQLRKNVSNLNKAKLSAAAFKNASPPCSVTISLLQWNWTVRWFGSVLFITHPLGDFLSKCVFSYTLCQRYVFRLVIYDIPLRANTGFGSLSRDKVFLVRRKFLTLTCSPWDWPLPSVLLLTSTSAAIRTRSRALHPKYSSTHKSFRRWWWIF